VEEGWGPPPPRPDPAPAAPACPTPQAAPAAPVDPAPALAAPEPEPELEPEAMVTRCGPSPTYSSRMLYLETFFQGFNRRILCGGNLESPDHGPFAGRLPRRWIPWRADRVGGRPKP
jgi:hypothetical protein